MKVLAKCVFILIEGWAFLSKKYEFFECNITFGLKKYNIAFKNYYGYFSNYFLFRNLENIIETSYKAIIGNASKIWDITSGGVKIAAITKAVKIAYFLLLAKSSGVIIPVLTSNNRITGNSKHNPNANISFIIKDKYSEILGSNSIGNEPFTLLTWNERKKSQARGITI